jgi:hypothetical protein
MNKNTTKDFQDIRKEINVLWEQLQDVVSTNVGTPTDMAATLDEIFRETEKEAEEYLQPYIALVEQAVTWLCFFHLMLNSYLDEFEDTLKVTWALSGTACSQAIAIWKLCLLGLDAPAKVIFRSFVETLDTCIITLYDDELRLKYFEATDFDEANKLWQTHFSNRKVKEKYFKIFAEADLEQEFSDYWNWREAERKVTSQAVHTSYLAASFGTLPFPADKRNLRPGFLGAPTLLSVRTLDNTSRIVVYFSFIVLHILEKIFSDKMDLFRPNIESDLDKVVLKVQLLLYEMVQRYRYTDSLKDIMDEEEE